jgi:hypothetical protein
MKMLMTLSVFFAAVVSCIGTSQADTTLKITCRQFKGVDISWDANKHPIPSASPTGFASAEITIAIVPHAATASVDTSVTSSVPMKPAHIDSDSIMLVSFINGSMIPFVNNAQTVTFYPKSSTAVFVFSESWPSSSASTQMDVGQCQYDHGALMNAIREFRK